MAEYIEREAAINDVFEAYADGRSAYIALEAIPAADVRPVVRGKWIEAHDTSGHDYERCSECGTYIESIYFANDYNVNYCPNCGARMDGDGA